MGCHVIAHRGANRLAPQNTLPAFQKAIEAGANGFETDVHLTKDGVPVICHNYTVDATSDGRGRIVDYTAGELKKFDFGSYFSEEYKGTAAPTLEEFLQLAAPSDAAVINIELKKPRDGEKEIVDKTLQLVKQYGVLDRVIISSFDPLLLKRVKNLEPRCKTGFLYPTTDVSVFPPFVDPFLVAKIIGADYLHPMFIAVRRGMVRFAHRVGLKVNVWTVDDERTAKRLLAMGVDGIITDVPDKILAIREKWEKRQRDV
ncbi:MAG: glycerophosphodiester phosphodiesterase [Clostridia bacterium]|nr:glycerophosphodiester phosphodiesterase [Clostridia bacterium]